MLTDASEHLSLARVRRDGRWRGRRPAAPAPWRWAYPGTVPAT